MTDVRGTQHELTPEAGSDVRLDLFVASRLDLSRTSAATLIANGHVLVNGKRERASYRPSASETVSVTIPPTAERTITGESIPLDVVYEDESILVVNKAAGMVVHPAPGNWEGTLVNALLGRGGELSKAGGVERAGLVHRLDKDTSGLLLVAKTERAHRVLGAALAARRIVRRYAVICWGHLNKDVERIEQPVARDPRDRQKMAVIAHGKAARTDFYRLARFDVGDLLRAHLFTGRTHQIRVHLSHIGHPVLGDDTYGGGGGRKLVKLPANRHFLHAARMRFRHPESGELLDLRAPLPLDLKSALATCAVQPELLDHPDPLDFFGFYDEAKPAAKSSE